MIMVVTALAPLLLGARIGLVDMGEKAASAAARAAVQKAVAGQEGVANPEMREAMMGIPIGGKEREQGEAALGRAKAAVAEHRCAEAAPELDEAETKLGTIAISDVRTEVAEIYALREACASERDDKNESARMRAVKEALTGQAAAAVPDGSTSEASGIEIRIDVTPSDCTVLFDGREVGRGSHTLPPGAHVVDVEKAGFRKFHRKVEVAPPGPVQISITLAALPIDRYAGLRAQAQSLRGTDPHRRLSALSAIALRVGVDRLLLFDVSGQQVRANLFDAEAGALDERSFSGTLTDGAIPGLGEFAEQTASQPRIAVKKPPKRFRHDDKTVWTHWYSWVLLAGAAVGGALFILHTTGSPDNLTVRAMK